MFINRVESYFIDNCRRTIQRVTTYGKHKDTHFVVDNFNYKGKTLEKRFVAWTDNWQVIRNKTRNKDGKFERMA